MLAGSVLAYPLRGSHSEAGLVLGSTLGFVIVSAFRLGVIGIILAAVPTVLLFGYVGRIIDRTAAGERSLPSISPLPALSAPGLRLSVVAIAYAVIPTLYLVATYPILLDSVDSAGGAGEIYVFLLVSTSVLGVGVLFSYLFPAATIIVVQRGSLRGMVALDRISATVGEWRYLVAWLQAILLVAFVLSLASSVAAASTLAGLLGVPLAIYAIYVSVHIVTRSSGEFGGQH